jgi:hypothetical protein
MALRIGRPSGFRAGAGGGGKQKIIRDEVGILRYIHAYGQASTKCYLVIEHEGTHYVGALLFDDATFCHQITNLLRQNIGRAIKDIGDLDISHTL